MKIDYTIRDEKLQYNINAETAKDISIITWQNRQLWISYRWKNTFIWSKKNDTRNPLEKALGNKQKQLKIEKEKVENDTSTCDNIWKTETG